MGYQSEVWAVTKSENILDVLKGVVSFGVVIANITFDTYKGYIRFGQERIDLHLIFPYCEKDNSSCFTYRAFNKMLFEFSGFNEIEFGNGDKIKVYDTPISPYAPGVGPVYDLKDCLFVPDNFSTIAEEIKD